MRVIYRDNTRRSLYTVFTSHQIPPPASRFCEPRSILNSRHVLSPWKLHTHPSPSWYPGSNSRSFFLTLFLLFAVGHKLVQDSRRLELLQWRIEFHGPQIFKSSWRVSALTEGATFGTSTGFDPVVPILYLILRFALCILNNRCFVWLQQRCRI